MTPNISHHAYVPTGALKTSCTGISTFPSKRTIAESVQRKVPYEDLRQEILTNLWLGLEQFRGASKLSTWVYRVAVNSALMAIRNYKPKVETLPFEISTTDISSEADDNKAEQLAALHELINQLLPIEKAIILLWLDEYSYEEIADIIGIERNNVATKLHRIKNKLISKSK